MKAGARSLTCAGSALHAEWVVTPSTPSSLAAAKRAVAVWRSEAARWNWTTQDADALLQSIAADSAAAQTALEIAAANVAKEQSSVDSYGAIVAKATSDADALQLRANALKDSYDRALADMKARIAELNAMQASYDAAYQSNLQITAARVLCDFGFGPCTSSAADSLLSAQNSLTIRQYNAKQAEVNAASAAVSTAWQAWLSSLAAVDAPRRTAELNTALLGIHQASQAAWAQVAPALQPRLSHNADASNAAHNVVERAGWLATTSGSLNAAMRQFDAAAKGKGKSWTASYLLAASHLTFARKQVAVLASQRSNLGNWSPSTDLPSPANAWKPASYYVASRYTDVARPVGVDFAWTWSKTGGCGNQSCSVAILLVDKPCAGAIATMQYRTDAGAVEGTSTSAAIDLTPGNPTFIEVPAKFTTTAKSGYLTALQCTRTQ